VKIEGIQAISIPDGYILGGLGLTGLIFLGSRKGVGMDFLHSFSSGLPQGACQYCLYSEVTLSAIFNVINDKFHPACLLIYLVNKQTGWHFFQPFPLFRSAYLLGTSE
jgi:hypothetical protein